MKIYGSEVWPSHVWGSDICGVSEILQSWMRDSELRYPYPHTFVCGVVALESLPFWTGS